MPEETICSRSRGGARLPVFRDLAGMLLLVVLCLLPAMPGAARPVSKGGGLFVVQNDRGGLVMARIREIGRLRQTARRVEIRGQVCLSSCTMFLGLPQTCVDPDTRFGFHGPSLFGVPMNERDFEATSRAIAAFYPPVLRDWYMRDARRKTAGFSILSGASLIELGVPECPGREGED